MAKLEIDGRAFELAPLRLGALRKAAAYLDRINERGAEIDSLEGVMESAHELCEVIAIALVKVDPACDVDWLEDRVGMAEMPAIKDAFRDLLSESGLAKKGEAQPLSPPPAGEGESPPSSGELSPS